MAQSPEARPAGDLASDPAAQKEYELLKVLAEHYFGSMLVTDDRGRFLYVSDGTCRLLGIDRETLLQISIYDTLKGYCFATSASSIKTLETKQECLSNHTLTSSGRQVLALSRPHFGPDGELQYVPTYSWDEEELYTLLEKFDRERDNVRNVIRFMQATDKTPDMIIAESDAMVKLLEYADHVATVDSTVILYGESGSGKEMFAKYIHARSSRASQVFIPINCASLPAPRTARSACSSLPTRAPSFWMRSARCPWSSRPSCCGSSRPARSSAWAATGSRSATCGSSPPPTGICGRWWRKEPSGRTCTTG